jgi:hypothetical protein
MIALLKQQPSASILARVIGAASLFLCAAIPASAVASTNSPPAASAHRSIFDPDLKGGKDPFFPNSVRKEERSPVRFEGIKPTLPPITQLALTGLSTGLAVINDKSFAENEVNVVRTLSGQKIRIHCRKITRDHVIITIEDDPELHQLRMRDF